MGKVVLELDPFILLLAALVRVLICRLSNAFRQLIPFSFVDLLHRFNFANWAVGVECVQNLAMPVLESLSVDGFLGKDLIGLHCLLKIDSFFVFDPELSPHIANSCISDSPASLFENDFMPIGAIVLLATHQKRHLQ